MNKLFIIAMLMAIPPWGFLLATSYREFGVMVQMVGMGMLIGNLFYVAGWVK